MKLARVLVPVDLSEPSRRALSEAVSLTEGRETHLTILHAHPLQQVVVLDFTYVEPPEKLAAYFDAATRSIEAWCEELGLGAARAAGRVTIQVGAGDPVETIVQASGESDLVVMGTHGRRGFDHLMLGSVAERVVRAAKCSVLIVR